MTSVTVGAHETAVTPVRRGLRIAEAVPVMAALILGIALDVLAPNPNVSLTVCALASGSIVAWISWYDLRTLTIPDGAVVALAIIAASARSREVGMVTLPNGLGSSLVSMAIDAALPGGILLLFREIHYRRSGRDGLGLGDVKLAAAGGLFVGVFDFSWALFVAAWTGLGFVAAKALITWTRPGAEDRLAFGAILAPAIWAVWIARHVPILASFAGG